MRVYHYGRTSFDCIGEALNPVRSETDYKCRFTLTAAYSLSTNRDRILTLLDKYRCSITVGSLRTCSKLGGQMGAGWVSDVVDSHHCRWRFSKER